MSPHLIAKEGPLKGLIFHFEEGKEWIIGRDPDECDFVIEDSTVSRKHLRCTKTKEGIALKNLSRINPSLINGEEISGTYLLQNGDRLQIGHTTFLYSEGEKEEEAPSEKKKDSYDLLFDELDEPSEAPASPKVPIDETQAAQEPSAYDTIFEDSEPSELPFLSAPDAPFLLKVIAGPNAGAEIGIDKGRSYTIGKDPNQCDISFQDLSVSKAHARLTVDDEGTVEIEDLGSKNGTAVNGSAISEKRKLTQKDIVALGTTIFLIIDRAAPQETIYSPVLPSLYEAPPTEEETAAKESEEIHWKHRAIPTKYLVMAVSFAAIFLIVFLSFFSLFKSAKLEIATIEGDDDIKKALEKFTDVQFSYNPASGKLFLVGHVATGIDYQELTYRIQQLPFISGTEDTVVIDELVCKTMNDVLAGNSNFNGVSIQSPEAGKFVVNGYVQNNELTSQLSDYLTSHFPYLDRLQNNVVVEDNLSAQIGGLFMTSGFGAVAYDLSNGEVILSGPYNGEEAEKFQALVQEINRIPGVRSVKNFAIATSPTMASINLSDQYKVSGTTVFGDRGYSVVLNGKIFTLGDTVDGMKLISIEPSAILLEKDGVKFRIDYTR